MKKILLVLCLICLGTVSCSKPAVMQPVVAPPVPEKIHWLPRTEETYNMIVEGDRCLLVYVEPITGNTKGKLQAKYLEEMIFTNSKIINLLNKMYVSVRYPETESIQNLPIKEDELPAFILIGPSTYQDGSAVVVSGIGSVDEMYNAFRQNDDMYKFCVKNR